MPWSHARSAGCNAQSSSSSTGIISEATIAIPYCASFDWPRTFRRQGRGGQPAGEHQPSGSFWREGVRRAVGVRVVHHNGYAYCTLAGHNPHSENVRRENGRMYSVALSWELCPDTCDARHVCATYPWETRVLVFADGYARWTNNVKYDTPGPPHTHPPSCRSGNSTVGKNCLKQNTCSGTYGAEYKEPKEPRHYWDDWGYDVQYAADVLLRRRLDA